MVGKPYDKLTIPREELNRYLHQIDKLSREARAALDRVRRDVNSCDQEIPLQQQALRATLKHLSLGGML